MTAKTECCGWTGWAEMAGMDADGRPLGRREAERPPRARAVRASGTRDVYALLAHALASLGRGARWWFERHERSL